MRKHPYLLEIFLALLIYNCCNFIFFPEDPGFMRFTINPYWIMVLLISCRYGFVPGVFAGALACANVLVLMFGKVPTRLELEKIVESHGLVVPIAFVVTGIMIGAIRQKYLDRQRESDRELEARNSDMEALRRQIEESRKTKSVLEARIVRETSTVRTLYDAAKRIETMEVSGIYGACLAILADNFQVEKSSLYMLEDGYCVLKAANGWAEGESVEGKVALEDSIMGIAVEKKEPVAIKDILSHPDANKYLSQYGQVLAMFPIRDGAGASIGVVNVEKMDFLLFSKANLELISLVVDWMSRAMENRKLYEVARAGMIWDIELEVFRYNHFADSLRGEFREAAAFGTDLCLALLKVEGFGFVDDDVRVLLRKTAIGAIRRCFRDTDKIFSYRFDGTFAVICPLRPEKDVAADLARVVADFNRITAKMAPGKEPPTISVGIAAAGKEIKKPEDIVASAQKKCGIKVL